MQPCAFHPVVDLLPSMVADVATDLPGTSSNEPGTSLGLALVVQNPSLWSEYHRQTETNRRRHLSLSQRAIVTAPVQDLCKRQASEGRKPHWRGQESLPVTVPEAI